jgi:hypothetical protein
MAENRPMDQPGGNVDYEKLREQYADQKREEQEEEEGEFINVTLNMPDGNTRALKVRTRRCPSYMTHFAA